MKKVNLLTWLCKTKSTHYETHRIPKRSGGFREINNPDKFLRLAQARILTRILNKAQIPGYTWAFEQGKSVPDMTHIHVNKNKVISLDIRNFFPSITQTMIETMLQAERIATGAAAKTISELVTYRWYLPQGGITSPKVSNLIVKHTFGPELKSKMDLLGLDFTVYADDITISEKPGVFILNNTDEVQSLLESQGLGQGEVSISSPLHENKVGPYVWRIERTVYILPVSGEPLSGRREILCTVVLANGLIEEVRRMLKEHRFKLNEKKTKVMSRWRRQTVCNVVVNDKPNLPQKERRRLRAVVHNVCTHGVEAEAVRYNSEQTVEEFLNHLKGKLNWYRQINPEKGNALYVKLTTYLSGNTEQLLEQEVA